MSVWDPDVFFSHGHEMEAPSATATGTKFEELMGRRSECMPSPLSSSCCTRFALPSTAIWVHGFGTGYVGMVGMGMGMGMGIVIGMGPGSRPGIGFGFGLGPGHTWRPACRIDPMGGCYKNSAKETAQNKSRPVCKMLGYVDGIPFDWSELFLKKTKVAII